MVDTVSVNEGQATPEQTEPVAPQVAPVVPVDKEELKSLLHEVVSDIHNDKTSQEAVQALIQEFTTAKNDFFLLCERIEGEIKKVTTK